MVPHPGHFLLIGPPLPRFVLGTKYLVPSTWYQVLGTKYLVPRHTVRVETPYDTCKGVKQQFSRLRPGLSHRRAPPPSEPWQNAAQWGGQQEGRQTHIDNTRLMTPKG